MFVAVPFLYRLMYIVILQGSYWMDNVCSGYMRQRVFVSVIGSCETCKWRIMSL